MKKVLKSLKWLYILLAFIVVLLGICLIRRTAGKTYESKSDAITTRRVFDYADKLTDSQEKELEELIAKRQKQTGYDIVLVTVNTDLSDYDAVDKLKIFNRPYSDIMNSYQGYVYENDFYYIAYEEDYAKQNEYMFQRAMWDEYQFGFNGHQYGVFDEGKGVIFVDNWFNENTWFGTAGDSKLTNFYEKNEAEASWHMLDLVGDFVVVDPFLAYKIYVETFYYDMTGIIPFNTYISYEWPLVAALILAIIWLIVKARVTKAKDTTTSRTYVNGSPVINRQSDIFVNKFVTKRTISSSSGGGHGGGGHGGHGGHGGGH